MPDIGERSYSYVAPILIERMAKDIDPNATYFVPLCITGERLLMMLQTLLQGLYKNQEYNNYNPLIDLWQAIGFLDECVDCMPDCGDDCIEYLPTSDLVEWFPNNPFTEPDKVGEGYLFPAWYSATPLANETIGSSDGDIITDVTRFPPGSLPSIIPASGLPRFRIHVNGQGIVRLHLVNVVAGSIAQITHDDIVESYEFVDLNRDITSVPPETNDEIIVEREISGDGEHWIDVIIVSKVNDEIPFLYHGGGLRKFYLCLEADVPLSDECCESIVAAINGVASAINAGSELIANAIAGQVIPPVVGDAGDLVRCRVADGITETMIADAIEFLDMLQADKDAGLITYPMLKYARWLEQRSIYASVTVLADFVDGLWSLTVFQAEAMQDQWENEPRQTELKCDLFCLLPETGKPDGSTIASWSALWDTPENPEVWAIHLRKFALMAGYGYFLRIAGISSLTETEFDCSQCGCTPPPASVSCFTGNDDFTVSAQEWYADVDGIYIAGDGWRMERLNANTLNLSIAKSCDASIQTVTGDEVEITISAGWNSGGTGSLFVWLFQGETQVWKSGGLSIPQGARPVSVTMPLQAGHTFDKIRVSNSQQATSDTARMTISAIRLELANAPAP